MNAFNNVVGVLLFGMIWAGFSYLVAKHHLNEWGPLDTEARAVSVGIAFLLSLAFLVILAVICTLPSVFIPLIVVGGICVVAVKRAEYNASRE